MNKIFTPKIIIFIVFLFLASFVYCLSSSFCDKKANDVVTKVLTNIQNKKSNDDVVLVVVDGKSISQRAWPWQRDLFSDIFDFLEFNAGAKSVVFQNLVVYPDTYFPENDAIFYQKLKSQKKLIFSETFRH